MAFAFSGRFFMDNKTIQTKRNFTNIPQDIRIQLPEIYEEITTHRLVENTLNYTQEQLGGYFHKYFPRSYMETHTVIEGLVCCSEKYRNLLSEKHHLSLLDIGAGIGGNMFGMLKYISATFPRVQSVRIDSVDGNDKALEYQARLIKNLELNFKVTYNPVHHVFAHQTLIAELGNITSGRGGYDIVMASKFINEFYRRDNAITGLYCSFIEFGTVLLNKDGILMITELTDSLPSCGHLNMAFNRETVSYYKAVSNPLKQVFPIQCHLWRESCEDGISCFVQQRYLSGSAKVFTQVFCHESLGSQFYCERYLYEQGNAPIRIKETLRAGGFCYHGKLRDTDQLS
jgi:hypothetical protein